MKRKGFSKTVCVVMVVFFAIWISMGVVDYSKVKNFNKPIFTIPYSYDDGGSSIYYGFGYSFEIEGNFMPEDEFPGVTYYRYFLFGKYIDDGIRD